MWKKILELGKEILKLKGEASKLWKAGKEAEVEATIARINKLSKEKLKLEATAKARESAEAAEKSSMWFKLSDETISKLKGAVDTPKLKSSVKSNGKVRRRRVGEVGSTRLYAQEQQAAEAARRAEHEVVPFEELNSEARMELIKNRDLRRGLDLESTGRIPESVRNVTGEVVYPESQLHEELARILFNQHNPNRTFPVFDKYTLLTDNTAGGVGRMKYEGNNVGNRHQILLHQDQYSHDRAYSAGHDIWEYLSPEILKKFEGLSASTSLSKYQGRHTPGKRLFSIAKEGLARIYNTLSEPIENFDLWKNVVNGLSDSQLSKILELVHGAYWSKERFIDPTNPETIKAFREALLYKKGGKLVKRKYAIS